MELSVFMAACNSVCCFYCWFAQAHESLIKFIIG